MTQILLFIKHRIPVIWRSIDWLNAALFRLLHGDALRENAEHCFEEFRLDGYTFRALEEVDLGALVELIERQADDRMAHFQPHGFDRKAIYLVFRNPSFLMFGVFADKTLVGYFFLRCFWNRRCFVGRLIDEPYEGRGIGRIMNSILYHTAWQSNFRCHTTISKENSMVMRSHANNPNVKILKELHNDYLLVEFIRPKSTRND